MVIKRDDVTDIKGMKFKHLISEVASFLIIAWLFWLTFYFHYVQQSFWYGDFEKDYQQLSLIFAYFMVFYTVIALLVLSILNTKVVARFSLLYTFLSYWPYFSISLKLLAFPLTIYGLSVVSVGATNE